MNGRRRLDALQLTLLAVLLGFTQRALAQAVPAAARVHLDRGLAAVELATTEADLQDAVREFQQAAQLAPGWPDAHCNLGKVQEKTGAAEDAAASLGRCLALAPDAPGAEDLRQRINKLQYKADKDARLKKVREMVLSPAYAYKAVDIKANIFIYPLGKPGLQDGRVVAYNNFKADWVPDFPPRRFVPDWYPVTFEGRTYTYRFIYYQCDLVGSRSERAPPYCPFDVSVKGEIISLDPPIIKELVTVSASWSSRPNPAGCPTGVGEFTWELVPK